MMRLFIVSVILLASQFSNADYIDYYVRSYPCEGGRSLGLYVMNNTGMHLVDSFCDFNLLRGYDRSSFNAPQNQALIKKCGDVDSPAWVKKCYNETFAAKCLQTKTIRIGGSDRKVTSITRECINESSTPGASSNTTSR